MSREMDAMLPWQRHEFIMQFRHGGRLSEPTDGSKAKVRSDMDAIRDHHRFIRADGGHVGYDASWEERLAARYYKKLVKEYAIVDLGRYKEGKVGMRWRTEAEVVSGKGQFECGSITCHRTIGLRSFEVPFVYKEDGETKRALVKVRVCEECAPKLYWKKTKELERLSKLLSERDNSQGEYGLVKTGAQRHDKRSRSNPEMDETKVQSEKSARHRSTEQESKTYGSRRLQSDFSEEAADKLIQDLLF